jgi:hypothetical protein
MHKGKGGTDDMAQYRAVCLEEVGLKLAASIMLARLSEEVGETRSNPKTSVNIGIGKHLWTKTSVTICIGKHLWTKASVTICIGTYISVWNTTHK